MSIYDLFNSPITSQDCGKKCAPYNEYGVPFCCDLQHLVPTAFVNEWEYLRHSSNLWYLWRSEEPGLTQLLRNEIPEGHLLIQCLGHKHCQRSYRSISCRAFPFAPYITDSGEFIGFSYYWEYENRCWLISNLDQVSRGYIVKFIGAYDQIFHEFPEEFIEFKVHSALMREVFSSSRRAIPLFHRNGNVYKISPHNERLRRVEVQEFPKHGVYKIAAALPFPDELPG
jgi:hypothetical protein